MAELLIRLIDSTHEDPAKDKSGCYKRGDIVHVAPDGKEWGNGEQYPMFGKVLLPGVSVEECNKYIDSHYEIQTKEQIISKEEYTKMQTKGEYWLFLSEPIVIAQDAKNVTLKGDVNTIVIRRKWSIMVDDPSIKMDENGIIKTDLSKLMFAGCLVDKTVKG